MIIKRLQNKEYNLLSKYINNFYKKGHILSKYKNYLIGCILIQKLKNTIF